MAVVSVRVLPLTDEGLWEVSSLPASTLVLQPSLNVDAGPGENGWRDSGWRIYGFAWFLITKKISWRFYCLSSKSKLR